MKQIDKLLKPSAYAEKHNFTRRYVSMMIKAGKLKTIKVGGFGKIEGATMIVEGK